MTLAGAKAGRGLSVVIPAYNAAATLPGCLDALARSHRRPDEIILFDDGSNDETPVIARAAGARVIRGRVARRGPAIGRNIAAAEATGSVLVFVDADVGVHPDALELLEAPILAGDAAASFGSYDDEPGSRRLAALYANLRHHWVHQQGRSEAFTFWSGLGAVRKDVFDAQHGFDPAFVEPSIEDVELGTRIIGGGCRIRLVKNALGTHQKDWGLWQLWKTDIFRRAVPWAQLIGQGRARANDLNISKRERASAIAAHLVWLTAIASIWRPSLWPVPVLAIGTYLLLNRRFFAFLFRKGGARGGLVGMALHWCYHVYASITFLVVTAAPGLANTRIRIRNASSGTIHAMRP